MVALFMLACIARGQVCGPQWLPGGTFAQLDDIVLCLGTWDPDGAGPGPEVLIAGGQFENASSMPVRHIAMWDGAGWHAMGGGLPIAVIAVTVNKQGELLACGGFWIEEEDRGVGQVFRWDGNAWRQLGGDFDSSVVALAVGPDGSVYAGGAFTRVGASTARAVARWDGTAWQPVGSGTDVVDGGASALAVLHNGDVVVGGGLSWYVNGVRWSGLARWDGATWFQMGATTSDRPKQMFVQPDGKLLVCGTLVQLGGISPESIVRWDGTNWSNVGDLFIGEVQAFSYASDTDIVAVGSIRRNGFYRGIARFNGTAWTGMGSGLTPFNYPHYINSATRFRGEIIAGGWIATAGGLPSPHIARWTDDHAPWFAVQPKDTASSPDRSAVFVAELAAESGEATYRWRRNGVPLDDEPGFVEGATAAELRLHNTSACDAGRYDCVATTPCGVATSRAGELLVCVGDLNGDGFVDDADFVGFVAGYHVLLARDSAMEAGAPADFNCDELVDDADFVIFVAAYDALVCS